MGVIYGNILLVTSILGGVFMFLFRYKIGLFLFVFVFSLLSFLLFSNNAKGATDSNPPILKSVTIDKKTINPTETVKIELELEDDLSGVGYVSINYQIGDINRKIKKHVDVKYNSNTLKWEGFVTPNDFQSGVWSIDIIYASDKAGNGVSFLRGDNTLISNGDFMVTDNGMKDTQPPTLKSVYIDKKTVNPVQKVKLELDIEDNLSGVDRILVSFQFGGSSDIGELFLGEYNHITQKWEVTMRPNIAQTGAWNLYFISVTDKAGNSTVFTRGINALVSNGNFLVTDQIDLTPPIMLLNDIVTDQSEVISGFTENGAVITLTIGTNIVYKTTASEGKFTFSIPKQLPGTVLTFFATDSSGNKSEEVNETVIDKTPPATPTVHVVSDRSKEITGISEPNAKITILVESQIYEAVTNEKGEFYIKIPQQEGNTEIIVTAIDASGNKSEEVKLTVIDLTPPATPKVNVVSDRSKELTGTSEPYATITVLIGSKKYEGVSNNKGRFTIKIPQPKANTQMIVNAIDLGGNVSANVQLTVLDKTPPPPPKVIINKKNASVITGTTEAFATITIKVGNKVIGTATANKAGHFTVKIPKQKKNTILIIIAKDKANNISKPTSIKIS
jgi:hypothetical protein